MKAQPPNPGPLDDFLHTESMATPGILGTICFLISAALCRIISYQYLLPVMLVISFLLGFTVVSERLPLRRRALFYTINSLVIFSVSSGITVPAAMVGQAAPISSQQQQQQLQNSPPPGASAQAAPDSRAKPGGASLFSSAFAGELRQPMVTNVQFIPPAFLPSNTVVLPTGLSPDYVKDGWTVMLGLYLTGIEANRKLNEIKTKYPTLNPVLKDVNSTTRAVQIGGSRSLLDAALLMAWASANKLNLSPDQSAAEAPLSQVIVIARSN